MLHEQVDILLCNHIAQHSKSPWASPVVLVLKKDGKLRFCVDYRHLNAITKKDRYLLPQMDDTLHALQDTCYISTFDITWGYWNVEINHDAIEKSAFITPNGLFKFVCIPFGLTNAPAMFQWLMDTTLASIK